MYINIENRLSEDILSQKFKEKNPDNTLYFFEETTSTFDAADTVGLSDGAVICARRQSGGRGRLGRQWHSEEGGIYMSVIKKADMTSSLPLLTAVCAAAVCKALSSHIKCMIKWPNDIVSEDGKKICGILSKTAITDSKSVYVNIGIGINVNTSKFDSSLPYAASIGRLTQKEQNENDILCEVVSEINRYCDMPHSKVTEEFSKMCVNVGKKVRVINYADGKIIEGNCIDINPDATLRVVTTDGDEISVNSGEVSVRGIYDYV